VITPIEFLASAATGLILGLSLLYLYWRYCFVHYTETTHSGPRSFWTELFGEGGYPISQDSETEDILER